MLAGRRPVTGCGAVWLARCVRDAEVPGSNPGSPTTNFALVRPLLCRPVPPRDGEPTPALTGGGQRLWRTRGRRERKRPKVRFTHLMSFRYSALVAQPIAMSVGRTPEPTWLPPTAESPEQVRLWPDLPEASMPSPAHASTRSAARPWCRRCSRPQLGCRSSRSRSLHRGIRKRRETRGPQSQGTTTCVRPSL